jgi:2'-5' RNA ligase
LRRELRAAEAQLEPLRDWLRLNAVERVHLTLHFLGHQPVAQVEALASSLAPVVAGHRRFALSARGVGAFPSLNRAEVVWAGIGGLELPRLLELQAALGTALRQLSLPVEERRFRPHLTLARVGRPLPARARRQLLSWSTQWKDVELGDLPVDEVQLLRSQLGSGPPRYSALATFSLQ